MLKRLLLAAALATVGVTSAEAQDQVTIRVGYSPGGSYDMIARLVADKLGSKLPGNPSVVVSNEPGAGSKKLAKLFQAAGATDGSELAVISSALALSPIFDPESTDFDPTKVHYIAALNNEGSYCITSKSSGITTVQQLLTSEFKVGATGKDSTTYIFPAAIKKAFGAKFDIVVGFEGAAEIDLAMERGDLQARCGIGRTTLYQGDMMSRVNIVMEMAEAPTHDFEGVDFVLEHVTDPEIAAALRLVFSSNAIHQPFVVPPGTPPELVEMLRAAFVDMIADPTFASEAAARGIYYSLTPGAEVEAKIAANIAQPESVKALARSFAE